MASGLSFNAGALPSGNYTFFLAEDNGTCVSARVPVLGLVQASPASPTAFNDGPVCEGEDLLLQASPVLGATYSWTGPNGFSSNGQRIILSEVGLGAAGVYTVQLSLNGCLSAVVSTTVNIQASPSLSGTIVSNSPLCEGETLSLTGPSLAGVVYVWTGPNGFNSGSQNVNISDVREADHRGFYSLRVRDVVTGCESEPLSTLVVVNNLPPAGLAINNGPLCTGETANLQVASVFGASYLWAGPNGFSAAGAGVSLNDVQASASGVYTVEVSVGACTTSLTTNLVVRSLPLAAVIGDTVITEGGSLSLFASGGTRYRWSPAQYLDNANSPNPVFSAAPAGTYEYSVFVSSVEGCELERKVTIRVLPRGTQGGPVFVDLFTPNGDGVNDTWEIGNLSIFAPYQLTVISRGGLVVLQTENYANDWDGTTNNGRLLPEGTYWYILRTENEGTFTGAVTLKR